MQWTLCTITIVWVHSLICFHLYQLSHFTMSCCGFGFTVTFARRRFWNDTDHRLHISAAHCRFYTHKGFRFCVSLCRLLLKALTSILLPPFAGCPPIKHMYVCVCARVAPFPSRTLKDLQTALPTSDYSIQICSIMRYICFLIPHVVVFSVEILNAVGVVVFFFCLNFQQISLKGGIAC